MCTAEPADPAQGAVGDIPAGSAAEPETASASPLMEQVFAVGILAFGLTVLQGARQITLRNEIGGFDARAWPILIGWCLVITSVWVVIGAFTRRRAQRDVEPATRSGWTQVVATVAITVVLLAFWYGEVSLLYLAPAYLIGLNLIFGMRNIKALAVFPAVITGFLYLVFQLLLKVPL